MKDYLATVKAQLRAGIDVGKQRVQIVKLGYERKAREKERQQAVAQLGEHVWRERLEHPDYAAIFDQVAQLEQQCSDARATSERLQSEIQHLEVQKAELEQKFAERLKDYQQQRAAAGQGSSGAAQDDQQLAALKANHLMDIQPLETQLTTLRQALRDSQQQIKALHQQSRERQHAMGEQIDRIRPALSELAEPYARLDALDQEIARIDGEIARLNQQIAAAGMGASRVLYGMIGGGVVLIILIVVGFSSLGLPNFGGGAVSAQQIRRDLEGLYLRDDDKDVGWKVRSDEVHKLDIVRRSGDRNAGIDRIEVKLTLRNNLMTVSSNIELLYKKYGDVWRLDYYEVSDPVLQIVSVRNEPNVRDLEALVREGHRAARGWVLCGMDRIQSVRLESKQGGTNFNGQPQIVYTIFAEYRPIPTAPPGQLQMPDLCGGRIFWKVIYTWDGSSWGTPSYRSL